MAEGAIAMRVKSYGFESPTSKRPGSPVNVRGIRFKAEDSDPPPGVAGGHRTLLSSKADAGDVDVTIAAVGSVEAVFDPEDDEDIIDFKSLTLDGVGSMSIAGPRDSVSFGSLTSRSGVTPLTAGSRFSVGGDRYPRGVYVVTREGIKPFSMHECAKYTPLAAEDCMSAQLVDASGRRLADRNGRPLTIDGVLAAGWVLYGGVNTPFEIWATRAIKARQYGEDAYYFDRGSAYTALVRLSDIVIPYGQTGKLRQRFIAFVQKSIDGCADCGPGRDISIQPIKLAVEQLGALNAQLREYRVGLEYPPYVGDLEWKAGALVGKMVGGGRGMLIPEETELDKINAQIRKLLGDDAGDDDEANARAVTKKPGGRKLRDEYFVEKKKGKG
jgi:hypothetical protein